MATQSKSPRGQSTRTRGAFGTVEKLPSGRYRAKFTGPDGKRYAAPRTFINKSDARGWLALQQAEIVKNAWTPPDTDAPKRQKAARVTFADYAQKWMKARELKPKTRNHYQAMLDNHLEPAFGRKALTAITADHVRDWHTEMGQRDTPTLRAHCYALLRTILGTAVTDRLIDFNPCNIRGAGTSRRVHKIRPASIPELQTIAANVPPDYKLMVLLSAWCALRYGEVTELRRRDIEIDDDGAVLHIDRAVVYVAGKHVISTPKSDAGVRAVNVPPHLVPAIRDHLDTVVDRPADSLLFPAPRGGNLSDGTFKKWFYAARAAAGRDDLRFHDLRHSGAVLAAATGATLAELMARLGHSSPAAAMRYQHAAAGRDKQIAALLSKIAENN